MIGITHDYSLYQQLHFLPQIYSNRDRDFAIKIKLLVEGLKKKSGKLLHHLSLNHQIFNRDQLNALS